MRQPHPIGLVVLAAMVGGAGYAIGIAVAGDRPAETRERVVVEHVSSFHCLSGPKANFCLDSLKACERVRQESAGKMEPCRPLRSGDLKRKIFFVSLEHDLRRQTSPYVLSKGGKPKLTPIKVRAEGDRRYAIVRITTPTGRPFKGYLCSHLMDADGARIAQGYEKVAVGGGSSEVITLRLRASSFTNPHRWRQTSAIKIHLSTEYNCPPPHDSVAPVLLLDKSLNPKK